MLLLSLIVVSKNPSLNTDSNQVYACATLPARVPLPTEFWLNLDNYGAIPSSDTFELLGLTFCVSLGHPTPVLVCFHFCTNINAEFGSPLRGPSKSPHTLVGSRDSCEGFLGDMVGGLGKSSHIKEGAAFPHLACSFFSFVLFIFHFSGCSEKQILPQVQPEPFCPYRSPLLTKYVPIRYSLSFAGKILASGFPLAQPSCFRNSSKP